MKKIKGLKKVKKFGIGKFLVMALVLGGGLVYGTQMVQKNQENRSNAAAPKQTCKCSKSGYDSSNLCSKAGGKWTCTLSKTTSPTATPVKKSSNQKYYFYNGTKCVQTGDSYATPSLCKGNVRSACYGSLVDCEKAHPALSPTSTMSCSLTNCGVCISDSTCNSAGCYWETQAKTCVPKVDITADCGSKEANTYLRNGDTECSNDTNGFESFFGGIQSIMIKCIEGKKVVVEKYKYYNCKKPAEGECVYNNSVLSNGESKCFAAMSSDHDTELVKCSNGKLEVKNYIHGDCDGNCTNGKKSGEKWCSSGKYGLWYLYDCNNGEVELITQKDSWESCNSAL